MANITDSQFHILKNEIRDNINPKANMNNIVEHTAQEPESYEDYEREMQKEYEREMQKAYEREMQKEYDGYNSELRKEYDREMWGY